MQVEASPSSPESLAVEYIGRISAVPKILQAVTHLTGMRFAAVSRVTETSWTACAVHDSLDFGLKPGGGLLLETTLCSEIRKHHQPIAFGKASADPHFSQHPCPKLYGFESYISVPILRADGRFFGTLCALDPLPAKLDQSVVRTLELFAELIASQLDMECRLEQSDGALLAAADTAKLRDQFIAVLGHDLRSPLQAMSVGTQMLRDVPLELRWKKHLDRMQRSCDRMSDLIRDVLDFARGRLGGGIPVERRSCEKLEAELGQVISEIQSSYPGRLISADISLAQPVNCDPDRIAQLFSNLLANAVVHGDPGMPIRVQASSKAGGFRLSVNNGGSAIPPKTLERLFEPFWRGSGEQGVPSLSMGLGLGLYIAGEIAKAHGGTLQATSTEAAGTTFVFSLPPPRKSSRD